jgi:hypothetical protein
MCPIGGMEVHFHTVTNLASYQQISPGLIHIPADFLRQWMGARLRLDRVTKKTSSSLLK